MKLDIIREKIGENVHFTGITDSRYKTNLITINFINNLSLDTASANALTAYLIDKSNSEYPQYDEFARFMSGMYKAEIYSSISTFGNAQIITVSGSAIDNKYALDNENLSMELCNSLCDCVFSPATENGAFIDDRFETERKNLIDDINASINEKRIYAVNRANEIMFSGQPCGLAKNGNVDTASALTNAKTFELYKKLINESKVEIIFIGCGAFDDIKQYIKDKFDSLSGERNTDILPVNTEIDGSLKEVTDIFNVVQSKMVLGFKSNDYKEAPMTVMSALYGGTPSSKLFKNVREKLSLCYYCASRANKATSSLKVDCGVESENIEKARTEILHQLELMCSGDITDDEVSETKLALINALKGTADSPSGLSAWYLTRILSGDLLTPDEQIERIKAVTKEEIIKSAQSLTLDTVYVLTGEASDE